MTSSHDADAVDRESVDRHANGLSSEEQRVADHRDLTPQERVTRRDYVGSGNDARSSASRAPGHSPDDGTGIGDRTEPGDGSSLTSAHRPAAGIPEAADPAQRPMLGTSEEFPVAEGVRTHVDLDERVHRAAAPDGEVAAE